MSIKQQKLLPARVVLRRLGVSDMTLYRWLRSPELSFPQPIYIHRRRYWDEAELKAFIDSRRTRV